MNTLEEKAEWEMENVPGVEPSTAEIHTTEPVKGGAPTVDGLVSSGGLSTPAPAEAPIEQEFGQDGQEFSIGGEAMPAEADIFANPAYSGTLTPDNQMQRIRRGLEVEDKLTALAGLYVDSLHEAYREDATLQYLDDPRLGSAGDDLDAAVGLELESAFQMGTGQILDSYLARREGEDRARLQQEINNCADPHSARALLGRLFREEQLALNQREHAVEAADANFHRLFSEAAEALHTTGQLTPDQYEMLTAFQAYTPAQLDKISRIVEARDGRDVRDTRFVEEVAAIAGNDPKLRDWFALYCRSAGEEDGKGAWSEATHAIGEEGFHIGKVITELSRNGLGYNLRMLFNKEYRQRQINNAVANAAAANRKVKWYDFLPYSFYDDTAEESTLRGLANDGYQHGYAATMAQREGGHGWFRKALDYGDSTLSALLQFPRMAAEMHPYGALFSFPTLYRESKAAAWAREYYTAKNAGREFDTSRAENVGLNGRISAFSQTLVNVGIGKVLGVGKTATTLLGRKVAGEASGKLAKWAYKHPWAQIAYESAKTYGVLDYLFPGTQAWVEEAMQRGLQDNKEFVHAWSDYVNSEKTFKEHCTSGLMSIVLGMLHVGAVQMKTKGSAWYDSFQPFRDKLTELDSKLSRAALRSQIGKDSERTVQVREMCNALFGKETTEKLFSGDTGQALNALREEVKKDPSGAAAKFAAAGVKLAEVERLEEAYRDGVVGYVLKEAGYTDCERVSDGKFALRYKQVQPDGTTQEHTVEWTSQQVVDWLASRVDNHVTKAVLDLQSRLRGEAVRAGAEWPLWFDISQFPAEVLDKLTPEERASGELTLDGIRAVSAYALQHPGGMFGETGIANADIAGMAAAAERREGAAGSVFPLMQAKSSSGDSIIYYAKGRITESDILHELLENGVREAADRDAGAVPTILRTLQEIQDYMMKRQGRGSREQARLLPDKSLDQMGHVEAVEGLSKLAEMDFAYRHRSIGGLSEASHQAIDTALSALGQTGLLARLGKNAAKYVEAHQGEDGYKAVSAALQAAGYRVRDAYKASYKANRKAALEAVKATDQAEKRVAVPEPKSEEAKPAGPSEPETIPGDRTATGEPIPASTNIPLPRHDAKTGIYHGHPGDKVETDAARGRGLNGNAYTVNSDGSVTGTAAIKNLKLSTKPTAELAALDAAHSTETRPVTVLRFRNGNLYAVDGLGALHGAKERREKHVDVRVYDVSGSVGMARLRKEHGDYLMSIGALDKEALLKHIDRHGYTREQADQAGLIPRGVDGEAPSSKAAWAERGWTQRMRDKDRFRDLKDETEKEVLRQLHSVRNQLAADFGRALRTKFGFTLNVANIKAEAERAGKPMDDARAVAALADKLQEALGLLDGRCSALLDSMGEILGRKAEHTLRGWSAALHAWMDGKEVAELPAGMDAGAFHELNELCADASPSNVVPRYEKLAQTMRTYRTGILNDILNPSIKELAARRLAKLDAIAAQYEPEDGKGGRAAMGKVSPKVLRLYQAARKYIEMDEAALTEEQQTLTDKLKAEQQSGASGETEIQLTLLASCGGALERGLGTLLDVCDSLEGILAGSRDSIISKREAYNQDVNSLRNALINGAQALSKDGKIDYTQGNEPNVWKPWPWFKRWMKSRMSMYQRKESLRNRKGIGHVFRHWVKREQENYVSYGRDYEVNRQNIERKMNDCALTVADFVDFGVTFESGLELTSISPPEYQAHRHELSAARVRELDALGFAARQKERKALKKQAELDGEAPYYYPSESALHRAVELLKEAEKREDEPPAYVTLLEEGEQDERFGTKNWKLTQMNAAYIILMSEQERGAKHLAAWGVHEEQIDKLRSLVDPRLMEFMYWARDYLHEQGTGALYEERNALPFRYEDNYFPFRFQNTPGSEMDTRIGYGVTPENTGMSAYSFLFWRVDHSLCPDFHANALEVFLHTLDGMNIYRNKAPLAQEMRDVMRDPKTRIALNAALDKRETDTLLDNANEMEHCFHPVPPAALDRFRLEWFVNRNLAPTLLTGSGLVLLKNLGSAVNVWGDDMYRGPLGGARLAQAMSDGFWQALIKKTQGVAAMGAEAYVGELQRLRADEPGLPMTPARMLKHPLFMMRKPLDRRLAVGQMPHDTKYNWLTAVNDMLTDKTLNMPDLLGMSLPFCLHYNHVYHEAVKRGYSPSEARSEAEMNLAGLLLRGAQPYSAESKASTQLAMPDPGITADLFCKSDILNKIGQALSIFRQTRDGYRAQGKPRRAPLVAFMNAYSYLLPFSLYEQSVLTAASYFVQGVGEQGADEQYTFFCNNLAAAGLLLPSLNMGLISGMFISYVNDILKQYGIDFGISTLGTAGQIAQVNQITETWENLKKLREDVERGHYDADTLWAGSALLRIASFGGALLGNQGRAMRLAADAIQSVNIGANASRQFAAYRSAVDRAERKEAMKATRGNRAPRY